MIKAREMMQNITAQLVQTIESGDVTYWEMPWRRAGNGFPLNASTERNYTGGNAIALWIMGAARGYTTQYWATFKQWRAMGANVRKGSKSVQILVPMIFEKEDKNGEEKKQVFFKVATVFNAEQVDGWTIPGADAPAENDGKHIPEIDAVVKRWGAKINWNGARACYNFGIGRDDIEMPPLSAFRDTTHATAVDHFYSTLFHEVTHWTGAEHRLNRVKSGHRKSTEYATEELIAELGSAFLCARFGLPNAGREDHAAYLNGWLQNMKADPEFLWKAAKQAQIAYEYVEGLE